LNIYGEGKDEQACRAMIEHKGLEDYIQLKGTRSREEIAQAMAKADFLFLYSEFENQPCVLNEAQACGLPIVVPDIPGILAFMEDELGLVFTHLNQAAFEEALLQMMDNYDRYNQANIRDFAIRNFTEKVIEEQFLTLYKTEIQLLATFSIPLEVKSSLL
jgi:glycosyltransferase involved in cell wall biosynthesis